MVFKCLRNVSLKNTLKTLSGIYHIVTCQKVNVHIKISNLKKKKKVKIFFLKIKKIQRQVSFLITFIYRLKEIAFIPHWFKSTIMLVFSNTSVTVCLDRRFFSFLFTVKQISDLFLYTIKIPHCLACSPRVPEDFLFGDVHIKSNAMCSLETKEQTQHTCPNITLL